MDSQSHGEPRVTPSPPPPAARLPGSLAAAAADRATTSNEGDDGVIVRLDFSGDSSTPSDNDDVSAESSSDDSAGRGVHPPASKLPKRVTRATLEPPEAKRAKSVSLFDQYLASGKKEYNEEKLDESWNFLAKADQLPYEEGQARDEVFYLTGKIMWRRRKRFTLEGIKAMYEGCLEHNSQHQGANSGLLELNSFLLEKERNIDGAIEYQEKLVRITKHGPFFQDHLDAQKRLKQLKKKRLAASGGGGPRAATQPGGEARHETTGAPAAAPSLTNVGPTPPGHGVAPSELLPPAAAAAPPVPPRPAPPAASLPSPVAPLLALPASGQSPATPTPAQQGPPFTCGRCGERSRQGARGRGGYCNNKKCEIYSEGPLQTIRESGNDDAMHDGDPPPRRAQAPEEEDESGPGGYNEEEEEEKEEDEEEDEDEEDDPEAEEDEPGTANSLILKEPSRRITEFDPMWAWILDIITKSHDLKSSVHKGSLFEEVTQAIFQEIYDTALSVKIVAASKARKQGDDGRDIVVAFPKTAGLERKIADCKNFKTAPATRPHVRSVIGSLTTETKIVKAMSGTGILLTTTRFTGPAKSCAKKFNKLWKNKSGFKLELWDLDRLKSELQEKFPSDEDEESVVDTDETNDMVNRLLNRIVTNLQEAKLAVFE